MPGMTIMRVPKPRASKGDKQQRKQKKQVAIIRVLMEEMKLASAEDKLSVAEELLSEMKGTVLLPHQCQLTIEQCAGSP